MCTENVVHKRVISHDQPMLNKNEASLPLYLFEEFIKCYTNK